MIQQYSGAFRAGGQQVPGGGPALNALDWTTALPATDPSFTLGGGLLDASNLQPPLLTNWAVQSVSVSAGVFLYKNPTTVGIAAGHTYGRLGRILTGIQVYGNPSLSSHTSNPNFPSPVPGQLGMPALPQDPSLITELWDPVSDPLPPSTPFVFQDISGPQSPPAPALLPVLGIVNLPQPLLLSSIGALLLGLWITPSLLGCGTNAYPCVQVGVANALYTINCDDGHGSVAPAVVVP